MISVALCTYNGAKHLKEQLDSLRGQTLLPAEVQVGDDGSTDDTVPILQEFRASAPFPVHVTVNEHRLGYGENFIQTARRCTSKWVGFCDQDDLWKPHKLARCAEEIGDGVSLIVHNADFKGDGLLLPPPPEAVNPPLSLLPRWFYFGFCQVFDAQILQYPRHNLPWAAVPDAHDVWIPFVAGMMGSVVWIDEPLAVYRQHGGNVSRNLPELSGEGIDFIESAGAIAGQLGFGAAARRYGRFAERLRIRAKLREEHSLRLLTQLLLSGAYKSGGYETFGRRGLIEDLKLVARL